MIVLNTVQFNLGFTITGYLGKIPGLLEEFLIANEQRKPIFLVGGLGGLTELLCKKFLKNDQSFEVEQFTENWQIGNNSGYRELNKYAEIKGYHADYLLINDKLNSVNMDELAENCGLTIDEYTCLMTTPFIEVAVHLILQGLKNINT